MGTVKGLQVERAGFELNGALAFLSCCGRVAPEPRMNVVARLSSSVWRVNKSHRKPRFRVKRLVAFQSSCKYAPISQLRKCRTLSPNAAGELVVKPGFTPEA